MPPVDEEAEASRLYWASVQFRGAVERGDTEAVYGLGGWLNPDPDKKDAERDKFAKELSTHKMTDGSNWTVLMIAGFSGQKEFADKFSKGGRNPKVEDKDPNGFQVLMLAALQGHKDICKTLIERKADVNAQDTSGETSLMKAAASGHDEVVNLLLASGADPDAEDCNGMSAVKKAARWGHVECLKQLLPKVKKDERQLKHCLLFGRLNGHEDVAAHMKSVIEPQPVEELEAGEAEDGVVEPAS